MNMIKKKKGDVELDTLVHIVFYLGLLLVLGFIVWALLTGKLTSIWESIVEKLRFA